MKKLFLLLAMAVITVVASAQDKADTTYWAKGGNFSFNATQVSLTNWAAGGQNNLSGVTKLQLFANYKKANTSFDNKIDLGFGLSKVEGLAVQKNEDIIDLQSKLGIKASGKWFYSASLSFKSQFGPGYSDLTNTSKTSNFLSPANLTLAIGMDYKPNDMLSVLISPLSGKMTIVNDKGIDATLYGLASADAIIRMEMGATVLAALKTDIAKNVGFSTELGLFSNYLDNPQNVDVDWKVGIIMKINDYLSAQIDTRLIYYADILDPVDNKAKVQFKELLGLGLNIKF